MPRNARRAAAWCIATVASGLLATVLAACTPEAGVQIYNGLDVAVDIYVEKPDSQPSLFVGNLAAGMPEEYVGTVLSGDNTCESTSRLVAVARDGTRYVFGPPLCRHTFWEIGKGSSSSTSPTSAPVTP